MIIVIPARNFIIQALQGIPLTLYGSGKQTRSFCYIDDLVQGLLRLMEGDHSGPNNLGNPDELTIKHLAEKVRNYINPSLGFVDQPLPQDDPLQRRPVISLAREQLGWEPTIGLDDGLKKTIDDLRNRVEAKN